jgi:3-methyl-2-oxobutanoate hydroxymethyltransferase
MSMHSYSLKPHLLWSGRPPDEGEQEVLRVAQQCTGPVAKVAPRYDRRSATLRPTAVHFAKAARKEARAMITVHDLKAWKAEGRRFTMLTAYDFPTAQILDRAGVPILLVGDSVGNNVLGYEDTLPVTMEEMLHHTRAVSRGAERAMVVGDLPFLSYQVSLEEGVRNAGRLVKEGGAHAVKLEGPHLDLVHRLVEIGIPVMAHVGLTPQSVHAMGGYRVQGRGEAAQRVAEQAEQLEKAGAFAVVLEAMPAELAAEITRSLQVPTIGIGAGPSCDAQVLVINDLLGLNDRVPKLSKKYADLREVISEAVLRFVTEVEEGSFPDAEHSYE